MRIFVSGSSGWIGPAVVAATFVDGVLRYTGPRSDLS